MDNGKEFSLITFSEAVEINPQIPLKRGSKYSFVEMKDLDNAFKYAVPSTKRELSGGARFQEKDTLFARITPCLENGKICQARGLENKVGFGSTEFLVFRGKEGVTDTDFVYYLSRSRTVRDHAEANLQGTSGRQRVSTESFNSLFINLPTLSEQKRIASILSSFDEKIDINRKVNQTLEEIAHAIFKEWFIDFNYPGATGEMVDSPLGPIPKGWRVGELSELCNITMGQSPPGDSYNEDGKGVPFFQGRSDFNFRFPSKRMYTIDPKRYAAKLDTLVSVRAPVGDMNVALENCCIGRGLAAVIEKEGNSSFTYYFLNNLTTQLKTFEDNGTVFGSITKKDFESIQCVIPPRKIINLFESQLHPVDESILNNCMEEESLKVIRDNLLTKFMKYDSGVKHDQEIYRD